MSLFDLTRIEEFYLFKTKDEMAYKDFVAVYRWCKTQFGKQDYEKTGRWCVYWSYSGDRTTFRFTDPSFATAFRLRWC